VAGQVVERLAQEMAKRHNNQDKAERDECLTHAQTQDDQSAGNEFDPGNRDAGEPEGPDRKESI
jgi:hypothetical protein